MKKLSVTCIISRLNFYIRHFLKTLSISLFVKSRVCFRHQNSRTATKLIYLMQIPRYRFR